MGSLKQLLDRYLNIHLLGQTLIGGLLVSAIGSLLHFFGLSRKLIFLTARHYLSMPLRFMNQLIQKLVRQGRYKLSQHLLPHLVNQEEYLTLQNLKNKADSTTQNIGETSQKAREYNYKYSVVIYKKMINGTYHSSYSISVSELDGTDVYRSEHVFHTIPQGIYWLESLETLGACKLDAIEDEVRTRLGIVASKHILHCEHPFPKG